MHAATDQPGHRATRTSTRPWTHAHQVEALRTIGHYLDRYHERVNLPVRISKADTSTAARLRSALVRLFGNTEIADRGLRRVDRLARGLDVRAESERWETIDVEGERCVLRGPALDRARATRKARVKGMDPLVHVTSRAIRVNCRPRGAR